MRKAFVPLAVVLLLATAGCAPAATPTPTLWPTWTPLPTLTPSPTQPTATPTEDAGEALTVLADLDQTELFVMRLGEGPPLVLVPGGPGDLNAPGVGPGYDHTLFRPEMDALAADFTLIYYDGRGRGQSGRLAEPARFRLTDDMADLESIRTALGYAEWSVLGWGYGATVAQFYARQYPERVSKLILLSPMPQRAAWDAETARVARDLGGDVFPAAEVNSNIALLRAFLRNDGPDGRPGKARDYRVFLRDIRTETLIIWAAGDPAPLAAAQEARDLIPGARLRALPRGGVMLWRESLTTLHTVLCEFIGCQSQ